MREYLKGQNKNRSACHIMVFSYDEFVRIFINVNVPSETEIFYIYHAANALATHSVCFPWRCSLFCSIFSQPEALRFTIRLFWNSLHFNYNDEFSKHPILFSKIRLNMKCFQLSDLKLLNTWILIFSVIADCRVV